MSLQHFIHLQKLMADGEFHSGEALGQALGLTRAGVWKLCQQLMSMGLPLSSQRRKGYRLDAPLELLDKEKILSGLSADHRLNELECLTTIDSTNSYLLERARQADGRSVACFAEHQSAGRGRRGRVWFSPLAGSLPLSLLWHFPEGLTSLPALSLAIAVSLIRALRCYGIDDQHLELKWPNDLLWKGKKLAGILLEFTGTLNSRSSVVIGLGLNGRLPEEQKKTMGWADWATIDAAPLQRNHLASLVLDELLKTVSDFETAGFEPFLEDWQRHDVLFNQSVRVETPIQELIGIARGIGKNGELILDVEGERRYLLTGEVLYSRPL